LAPTPIISFGSGIWQISIQFVSSTNVGSGVAVSMAGELEVEEADEEAALGVAAAEVAIVRVSVVWGRGLGSG
jgi:hypothetical protein